MSMEEIKWFEHPKIYEINTWPWLQYLSSRYNEKITLANVPKEIFNEELKLFDAMWLMGVWERSLKSKEIATDHPDLQIEYENALGVYSQDDVIGSPYSVFYYHVDNNIGGREGLREFRRQLLKRDVRLILDYVPNHVAVDHLWTLETSDVFIRGTEADLKNAPDNFFKVGNSIFAHGRDPYFLPWTDTVQINAFSSNAREKAVNTLLNIAEMCDGARCDMAMLVTNEVFKKTWGDRAGTLPTNEFWVDLISKVRAKYPEFLFIAEVYWDMEWELQKQGFNFCYDKTLYDRMLYENAESIHAHLHADWLYQIKLLRFIENHDEKRAGEVFGDWKSRAGALLTLTLPGAGLVHEGQLTGYMIKLPVQLGRRTIEHDNPGLLIFYRKLLEVAPAKELKSGKWRLYEVKSVGNDSYKNLIAYQWWTTERRQLIVVNFSANPAQGHVVISDIEFGSDDWIFNDVLNDKSYTYNGENLSNFGLFIGLAPWNSHIFEVVKSK
jgi:hypothetical protein